MEKPGYSAEYPGMYRERPSDNENLDLVINEIRSYLTGERQAVELPEAERNKIIDEERKLAETLEKIDKYSIKSMTLFPSYFASEKGQKILWCIMNKAPIPANLQFEDEHLAGKEGAEPPLTDPEEIKKVILENSAFFATIDLETRKLIQRESSDFEIERIKSILKANLATKTQDLSPEDQPKRINVLLSPEKLLDKLNGLRRFKEELKQRVKDLNLREQSGGLTETDEARREILLIYIRKVNYLIADNFANSFIVFDKKRHVSDDSLMPAEREILESTPGLAVDPERSRSRIDKFMHGASREYFQTEEGLRERSQISSSLEAFWREVDNNWLKNQEEKNAALALKRIDGEKLETNQDIAPEELASWAREILDKYGILTTEDEDDEEEATSDKKWRVVVSPDKTSMEVNAKSRILYIAIPKSGGYSGLRAISVALGHEIAHVLQTENRLNIPLRIFSGDLRSSRYGIFSEGGAMYVQNEVTKDLFGFETVPVPHYIKAMLTKLKGGDYLECVKSYYESSIREAEERIHRGEISEEEFDRIKENKLNIAIDNTIRLFSKGTELSYQGQYLSRSEDTAYLEQIRLLKRLENAGMEELAFVGGTNLHDFLFLVKYKFLDISNIKKFDMDLIRSKWEEISNQYRKS